RRDPREADPEGRPRRADGALLRCVQGRRDPLAARRPDRPADRAGAAAARLLPPRSGTLSTAAAFAYPAPRHNKWLVTISVTFGTLMGALDGSIVNVAIPHIRGAIGATVEEITWVTTGYALAQ